MLCLEQWLTFNVIFVSFQIKQYSKNIQRNMGQKKFFQISFFICKKTHLIKKGSRLKLYQTFNSTLFSIWRKVKKYILDQILLFLYQILLLLKKNSNIIKFHLFIDQFPNPHFFICIKILKTVCQIYSLNKQTNKK